MAGKHKRVGVIHLTNLLQTAGITPQRMSAVFGISESALGRWIKAGNAPAWTLPAAKVFDNPSSKQRLIIAVIPEDKWPTAEAVLEVLGFEQIGSRKL